MKPTLTNIARQLPAAGRLAVFLLGLATAHASQIWIGGASVDITPDKPVALSGLRSLRISQKAETPLTATALALESRDGKKCLDTAIIVSCDIVAIRQGVLEKVRQKVEQKNKDIDTAKIFLSATHTHAGPVTTEDRYTIPENGIMKPAEYTEFMTGRVADAIAQAWRQRQPGKVGWGQGQAVVAQNRRITYADGTTRMSGPTNTPDFRGMEGCEDHNLDVLFFWDCQDRLLGTAINVPCPAQHVHGSNINADFWHPVRNKLREQYGQELFVLAWTGAAGDQMPLLRYDQSANARMRKLRGDLTPLEEMARRIVNAWNDTYEVAQLDKHADAVLRHCTKTIALPMRKVTDTEVAEARKEAAKYANNPAQRWNYLWQQDVVERYEAQQAGTAKPYPMELHVLRLGDVAIATNDFELFTDYGIQIKARSPAVQNFVIQLAGPGTYIPTERAVRGGSYSAVIQSNRVGPEGGQVLVNQTVETIKSLWPSAK
jgi:hypothetical protein